MSSPLDYLESLNFNTKRFQKFSQIVETFPPTDAKDVKVCVCRCWQSKKFPYCDGTHKLLMENGDNVGPYVAILKAQKTNKNNVIRIKHPLASDNKNYVNNTLKSPAKIVTLVGLMAFPILYYIYKRSKYEVIRTDQKEFNH